MKKPYRYIEKGRLGLKMINLTKAIDVAIVCIDDIQPFGYTVEGYADAKIALDMLNYISKLCKEFNIETAEQLRLVVEICDRSIDSFELFEKAIKGKELPSILKKHEQKN